VRELKINLHDGDPAEPNDLHQQPQREDKKRRLFSFLFVEIIISHNPMMKTILVLEANTPNRIPVQLLPLRN
jgi:hypothetical protein